MADSNLEGDHPRIISGKLVEIGSVVSEENFFLNFTLDGSCPKMCPAVRSFDQDGPYSRT
jgi:hypothetical protein